MIHQLLESYDGQACQDFLQSGLIEISQALIEAILDLEPSSYRADLFY